jgi:hypothetical protein
MAICGAVELLPEAPRPLHAKIVSLDCRNTLCMRAAVFVCPYEHPYEHPDGLNNNNQGTLYRQLG